MANVIENIIRAKDEATPTLRTVRAEFAQLSNTVKSVPTQVAPGFPPQLKLIKSELQGVGAAIQAISPQASAALAPMQAIFSLGVANLGPISLAVAGLAVTVGVLGTAAKKAADEVAALGEKAEKISNLAQSTGVLPENIQGLSVALEDAGIPAEALTVSFRQLNKAIAEQDPVLRQLGITTTNTFDAFLQLSDLFARSPDGANKTAAAVALLGRSGEQLIPVMNRGGAEIEGMIGKARDLGVVLTGETIASLKAVDDQFDELGNRVTGLKTNLALLAVPVVSGLVEKMNELLAVLVKLPTAFDDLIEKLRTAPGFAKLEEWVKQSRDLEGMQGKLGELLVIYNQYKAAVDDASTATTQSVKQSTASQLDNLERITAKVKQLHEVWRETGSRGVVQGPLTSGGAFGPAGVPTAAEAGGIPAPPKPPAGKTEREKMLERLQELLRLTGTEAARAYADLQRLDNSSAAATLQAQLEKARGITTTPHGGAPVAAGETPGLNPAATSKALQDMLAQQEWANAILLEESQATAEAMARGIEDRLAATDFSAVVGSWRETVARMLEPAQVLDSGMRAVFDGLQSGFQAVFLGMMSSAQTFKSAMTTLFKSLVASILQELAKLAALRVFKLLAGFPFSKGGLIGRAQGGLVPGLARGGQAGIFQIVQPRVIHPIIPGMATGGQALSRQQVAVAGGIFQVPVTPHSHPVVVGGPALPGFPSGGKVYGPGTETSDSILVRLSRGEFVVRAAVVKRPGVLEHLETLNSGVKPRSLPRMAVGGLVSDRDLLRSLSRLSTDTSRPGAEFYGQEPSRRGASAQDPGRRSDRERGGDTYVIQAINARDAIMSLTQPQGELRRAMDRVAISGAY